MQRKAGRRTAAYIEFPHEHAESMMSKALVIVYSHTGTNDWPSARWSCACRPTA